METAGASEAGDGAFVTAGIELPRRPRGDLSRSDASASTSVAARLAMANTGWSR